ncbi:biotin--[acetyl-CoA-carboxylase] ligase [Enterococcus massiliensis]|uniref:biotin--[acetyl-CoA-carboxylase] ligase n=1 Tax=Enterococcus massiliensis TaxID=1640685 RepID=UPI00065E8C7F|nr:biotin--[acetyl-CoA-carboxylase] ligase [Enterococcus massiliensis]
MTTKKKLLHLLKQSDEILSGEKLAQSLAVSRTAIWKAVRELEKEGYRFEHAASGYRYLPSDVLAAEEIKKEELDFLAVEILNASESTMKDAKLAAMQKEAAPRLFVADTQTGAHGRFGRPFFAPTGQIYMSLLLSPNKAFAELPQYTLLAAVAASQAIDRLTEKKSQIKWVNDIYLEGKKVCGILSEAISDFESGTISHVIIGMGINFSIPQADFPEELQEKAGSLFPNEVPAVLRNQLIHEIWRNFFQLIAHLPATDYLTVYREKSLVLGKNVTFTQQDITYRGVAEAITDQGELVVSTPEKQFVLSSGEISLQKID